MDKAAIGANWVNKQISAKNNNITTPPKLFGIFTDKSKKNPAGTINNAGTRKYALFIPFFSSISAIFEPNIFPPIPPKIVAAPVCQILKNFKLIK